MSALRRARGGRLVAGLAALIVLAAVAGVAAKSAFGGGGSPPPAMPLDRALRAAAQAPPAQGLTARITFTNHLLPSGALPAGLSTPLLSGASGRLWWRNDGRFRLELQSDSGDTQIVNDGQNVTVYDASSNTVYKIALPADQQAGSAQSDQNGAQPDHAGVPGIARIDRMLTRLGRVVDVSGAIPGVVAGQPAYTVRLAPKHDGGLLGRLELAWDAVRGLPLRVAVYAQGDATPVLELAATNVSYGPVAMSDVAVAAPAGAKVVDVNVPTGQAQNGANDQQQATPPVQGLAAVRAAAPFAVSAPASLVGLARHDVRLVNSGDHAAVVATYGRGLGGLLVVERPAPATPDHTFDQLPGISINGVTGRELSTALGTAITFTKGGVSYLLVGSLPAVAAESAARGLG